VVGLPNRTIILVNSTFRQQTSKNRSQTTCFRTSKLGFIGVGVVGSAKCYG